MATSAPAMAVRQPSAEDAQSETPLTCNSIIVDNPHTTQAPERKTNRRTSDQPRAPSLSARHISPDTPPIMDRTINNQIGISANACCSVVIACPINAKTRRKGRV